MKKLLITMLFTMLLLFCLTGCGGKKDNADNADGDETAEEIVLDGSDLTIYANGGTLWLGKDEPYETEVHAIYMDLGTTAAEALDYIADIEKEGAEFDGWTIYAAKESEWVFDEVTDLSKKQICLSCGDYGYYLLNKYEIISESATVEDITSIESDGRDYYIVANWK